MWKITYGLAIAKVGKQEPVGVKDDEYDDNNEVTVEGHSKMNVIDQETTEVE